MAHPSVSTDSKPQRALVVAIDLRDPRRPLEPELAEFEALARSVGVTICEQIVQKRDSPDPATLIGSGLLAELSTRAEALDCNLLLVFNELRPRQRKNIEKAISLPIVDRTMPVVGEIADIGQVDLGQAALNGAPDNALPHHAGKHAGENREEKPVT